VGPDASEIYVTSRTTVVLDGDLTSCTELSGTATLQHFDNHVLGCETSEAEPCTDAQTQFLDDNRTDYSTMPGTFTARIVDESTSCEEIRAALPM
jgi:hypothetical protein